MQDADFRQALGDSFIEIAGTDEGKDIIKVFSQVGYEWAMTRTMTGNAPHRKC